MKSFAGHGFEISADGAFRRTMDIARLGFKGSRVASGDLKNFVQSLDDKLSAGEHLEPAERLALAHAKTFRLELDAVRSRADEANELERREAAAFGTVDTETRELSARLGAAGASFGEQRASRPVTDRTFLGMFGRAALAMEGWESSARPATDFCRAVGLGLNDKRLRMLAASMDGGTGSSGGFAIPPGMFGPWLNSALESEIVRPRATVWPMLTRERTVPAWDIGDRSTGVAGLAIDWTTEAPTTDATAQAALLRTLTLIARRGAIYAQASNELAQDGLSFDEQLSKIMSLAIGFGLDTSFFFGTGSESPLGIFNSPALISVTRNTTGVIVYEDLVAMFARMSPASIPNSVWVAHSSTIPKLATLAIPVGTGGSHVPVMTQADGGFVILTRPVIFSEKVKPLGQFGDVGLFDFSQYVIGLRQDATLDRSAHVGFIRNMMTFRLQLRVDGQPNIMAPYQPPNSAPTQSPFVALAA